LRKSRGIIRKEIVIRVVAKEEVGVRQASRIKSPDPLL